MNPLTVTVYNEDAPAFSARYGLALARNGAMVGGLPDYQWYKAPGQTPEQAALCRAELKDGMVWQGAGESVEISAQNGVVTKKNNARHA